MDDAFDLNLLTAFDALFEEQHVTRAGTRLGLSQPAMSAALARLRRATGDELFVRGPHGLAPTPRALDLAGPLRSALREIKDALSLEVQFDPAPSRRTFRVAVSDHPAAVLMPHVVARVGVAAPGIDLRITSFRNRRDAIGLLDEGRIDIGIGVSPGREARILSERLYDDRFVTIARSGTDVSSLGEPARFAHARHLLVSPEGDNCGVVDDALAKRGLSRRIVVSVANMHTAVAMVAQSDLVATVLSGLVPLAACGADVLVMDPPLSLEPVTFEALWHRRTDGHAAHRWFRALLEEESRRLVPE